MTLRDDTEPGESPFFVEEPSETRPYRPSGTTKAATGVPAFATKPPARKDETLDLERFPPPRSSPVLQRAAPSASQPSARDRSQSNGDDFAAHYSAPVPPPSRRQVDDPSVSIEVSDTLADTSPPRLSSVTSPQFTTIAVGGVTSGFPSATTPGTQPITQPLVPSSSRLAAALRVPSASSSSDALRRVLEVDEPPSPAPSPSADWLAALRDQSTGLPEAARSRRRWVVVPLLLLTALLVMLAMRRPDETPKVVTTTSATRVWVAQAPRGEATGEDVPPPPLDLPSASMRAVPPSTASAEDARGRAPSSIAPATRRPATGPTKHDIAESYEYE